MIQNSSTDGRLDFDTAVKQLIRANFSPRDSSTGKITKRLTNAEIDSFRDQVDYEQITQGYLWLSATLSPAKAVIQFTVVDTQQVSGSPVTPINNLLTMQDSFLVSNWAYYVGIYQYVAGSFGTPDFTAGNNWAPVTYASPWDNNGIGVDWDPGCSMFWIGASLTLNVNKKVLIPKWDCYRHYNAPQTQATPGFPVPSNYIPNQKNQLDGSSDGFYYVQPNVIIGGGRNNDLYLNLPANIPATIAPFNNTAFNVTFVPQAQICMRGILMQNSTAVK